MNVTPPTVADESELVTIIRTYNDVTERLKRSYESLAREVCRLREELHEKNRELQRRERLAALGEMAAGVAHEIRNPLGGIGLFTSLLARDLADRPKQLEIVRKMSAAIWNLEGVVSDILAFAGNAEPNRQPVRVSRIIDAVLEQATPKAESLRIRLEVDEKLRTAKLYCDAAQIERALLNLVFNALDAAGAGGHVRVRGESPSAGDGLLRIVVEDDGPGIAPELGQRVFNPFFTTKEHGTGLGLAIVHRIAEANGGSVTWGNREKVGARFVLSVPLFPDDGGT